MLPLKDVTLVVIADAIPTSAATWPVRVIRSVDCPPEGQANAYVFGPASEVQRLLGQIAIKPLGILVDSDGLSPDLNPEVVPSFTNGLFSDKAWEEAVAAVCHKHVETVQAMILGHAQKTPQKTALIFEDRRYTFQELMSVASDLVLQLQAMGIEPQSGAIAVEMVQSDLCLITYLGLYAARYKVHRVDSKKSVRDYQLHVCPSVALLCDSGCAPEPSLKTIFVDKLVLDRSRPIESIQVQGELDDIVFIEYTSGSTGRPKSIAQRSGPLGHWIRWHEFHFPLVPGNDVVAYNLFFIWYWQISLCQGGTTVVYPAALNHDVSGLMKYVGKHEAHRCNCLTPGLISALLEVEEKLPASLKIMLSGGEGLPVATCRRWLDKWPEVELINNIATTETAADLGFCRITPEVAAMDIAFAPMIGDGLIIWQNKVDIVDGVMVVTGYNIPDGYLPPTQSDAFFPSSNGKGNVFRTSDRVEWRDGKLVCLGRVDSVVKVRGHRVDLAGLEAVADKCDAVKDIAIVAWEEAVWAVVVTEDLPAVKRFMEEELAQAHLIVYRQWAVLPYTLSGKRDRVRVKQLLQEESQSAPTTAGEEGAKAQTAKLPGGPPQTDEERRVAAVWKDVLGLGRTIGREEPFLQAGGHSVAAMKVAKQLGVQPAEVFAFPTVSAMASRLLREKSSSGVQPSQAPAPLDSGSSTARGIRSEREANEGKLPLNDITLVAIVDTLPTTVATWPVRVIRSVDCPPQGQANAYVFGPASEVQRVLEQMPIKPLGILVDSVDGFSPDLNPEVVPSFTNARFSDQAWEEAVAAVCHKHIATVQAMILDHARKTPQKTALLFEDRQYTFEELMSVAMDLVFQLKAMGIEPQTGTLAVEMVQTDICLITYLGLFSARYTFQRVDPKKTVRDYQLEVCPSVALLCDKGSIPEPSIKTIIVEELVLDRSRPIDSIQVQGELDDIVFIEYTSGSTGRPKSVAQRSGPLAHWIRWHEFHLPLVPGNDVVAYNLFFIWYWHISLAQGGTTVVYPAALNHDVSGLIRYVGKLGAHRCNCLTPGLIGALLDVEDKLPESLKIMISGGEGLPIPTCRRWLEKWPQCKLMNNIATTETAADLGFCRITPEVAAMDIKFAPMIGDGLIIWQNTVDIVDGVMVVSGYNMPDGYLPPTKSDVYSPMSNGRGNIFRTSDRVEWRDGKLVSFGRVDSVVKVRGHRVDLAGFEAVADKCDAVKDIAIVAWEESVWACVVTEDLATVKSFMEKELAQAHLIVYRQWDVLPYTLSGKRDRVRVKQLLQEEQQKTSAKAGEEAVGTAQAALLPGGPPQNDEERRVAAVWTDVLGLGRTIGREEPFQQAGGHSIAAMKVAKQLGVSPAEVFAFPTVSAMAARLLRDKGLTIGPSQTPSNSDGSSARGKTLAVVGMAGRFPGALSTTAFWEALNAGKDLITTLDAGPDMVPRKGIVPDLGLDCAFWGIPRELAAGMDTAQRALLELAYEALEDADLDPLHVPGRVGVVLCGGSLPHYADMLGIDLEECRVERPEEYFALEIGTDKDYLASTISFRLNLHGPSEVVQTACSSGLVAIVRAVQMLRLGLCDYVLCGGGSFSPDAAVRKVDGMIWSADGVCRPFAEGANGTVNADGAGVIVLTHLDAAQKRGERVYATVLGAATNNDGARKAGYSAPSFEGQVEVIREAHADAGITGDAVDYVEAHGTGTKLGDPLEVTALTEALQTKKTVQLGSVKGNMGHMNTAAGVPGFIKTTLMLYHQRLVPSLHASNPSRMIDWERTPLRLVASGGEWNGRVAAVSSFGIGGTNAHVVLGTASDILPAGPKERRRTPRVFERSLLTTTTTATGTATPAARGSRQPRGARVAAAPPQPCRSDDEAPDADPVGKLFYETAYERVEVSCMELEEAAVLLEGGGAPPPGLPPRSLITEPSRALVAARAAGGALLFVGCAEAQPAARDDTSQEVMLLEVARLLAALGRAPAARGGTAAQPLDVFFVLDATPRYAGLWGLLRVAAHEHPELRLRRLLREPGAPLILPALPVELVLRRDGAYAPRLRRAQPPVPRSLGEVQCKYQRVLVTGGLRGLGVKVAEWLAKTGRAAQLVLAGRNPAKGPSGEVLDLVMKAVPTEVCICDVAEWADVEKLPADCDLVIHCAGNVKDGLLINLTEKDAKQVLRPKIRGSLHLKERYPKARLLAFSSSSGLFGSAGQGTYAAANTFLDAVMPSVQWGGWGEIGMAEDLDISPLPGERFLKVQAGLECLGRVLDGQEAAQPPCVLDAEWASYRQNQTVFMPDEPLLADVEVPSAPRSLLGVPRGLDGNNVGDGDEYIQAWELLLGPAGSRWHGTSSDWEVCQQHVVGGAPIFPATAFISLALSAAGAATGAEHLLLSDIVFLRPLQLVATRHLLVTLVRDGAGGKLRFSSRTLQDDGTLSAATLHCTCAFSPGNGGRQVEPLPEVAALPLVEGLYARFDAAGFCYGPAFRAAEVRCDGASATCKLPAHSGTSFPLHPADLDSAMHLASLLQPLGCRGAPKEIKRLAFRSGGAGSVAASARGRAATDGGELELQVFNGAGSLLCSVDGLVLAALDAPPVLRPRRREWRTVPSAPRGPWLCVGKEAAELQLPNTTLSEKEPHDAVVIACRANSFADVVHCREQAREAAARRPCWVAVLESPFAEAAAAAAAEVGAQAVIGTPDDLLAAAGGLGVSAPVLRAWGSQLSAEFLQPAETPQRQEALNSEPFKVFLDQSKAAKGAHCRRSLRRAPEAHEVEIKASLWALNFRDVLVAVGAISSEVAGQSLGIGGECCGEVTSVGSSVTGVAVGDRVIAVPPDGMGSYLTTDSRWVTQAPASMTPEQAVSGTMVYATAWLGLHWMARIRRGDRVLVHSAAGGVGLAAVHLCLREGCTVFVTASTTEKRNHLLQLGVAGAFDSRNVAAFTKGVRDATGNEGVDVVLNSLSGDALEASIRLLCPFGRFIELGKRDQYENTRLGLEPFLGGLTYAAAHVDVLMLRHPDRARRLFEEVWKALPDLPYLPCTSFQMSELSGALEYFSKGVHIGKVLVAIGDEGIPVLPALPVVVRGPPGDKVAESLREATGAATDGPGGVLCVPSLRTLSSLEELAKAQVVLTASRAVAALAAAHAPEAVCVEQLRWEPVTKAGLDEWLALGGGLAAVEEEQSGDLREWLVEVLAEMAGSVRMDDTFETIGLDSLSLISLARRLSAKVGAMVSVADLFDHPTPRQLLDSFAGRAQPQVSRPKALCLHGFRSNRDAMSLQVAPFVSSMGEVEWIFINSPRKASGQPAPNIPAAESFEWWGQKDGDYETGWMAPHFDGLDVTLPLVKRIEPRGVLGFSQGGAMATLIDCAWVAVFSAVVPPNMEKRTVPSWHCWDLEEDFANQCDDVYKNFVGVKEVHHHSDGHNVPRDKELVQSFAKFVAAQTV